MTKLDYYCKFKNEFIFEEYIDKIVSDDLRKCFTCLRLCSHNLEIEFGRYNAIERENRLCKLCNQKSVESEYHFLLCCTRYTSLRTKYLGNISWPCVQKFNTIMSSKNKIELLKISKYIKESMFLRKNTLDNITVS